MNPRKSALDRAVALRLAATEYQRRRGENGPGLTLDAADFCRATARRPASVTLDQLMNTEVPY